MDREHQGEVTQLLARWGQGDRQALDALTPLVYSELHKLASRYLERERSGHTLQPTALVSEAWLVLVRQDQPAFQNRHRFFALAAQVMRHILVDYARAMRTGKRGATRVTLSEGVGNTVQDIEQFLALDQALDRLARFSPRQAKVIEMRHFGGLTVEEIAELLEVSAATISRDQQAAEAWLSRWLASDEKP
jgi:RNA polymerase sigma factor (TIGR02999 family)